MMRRRIYVMVAIVVVACFAEKGVVARTPETLSNFQELHQCDVERTLISRPESLGTEDAG